ncbi:B-cell receptor CD22 [Tachyglossus aculeatus]|uniref:B-cell receptor CD22 n=1 Tax=Tachyglossus aculeatus TaxID=9261 RepID=UPI0018F53DCE|nr:B-cell receptor CD22 [Tachyglossus aculeatus]
MRLLMLVLLFLGHQAAAAQQNKWKVILPKEVWAWHGACVWIPCSYTTPRGNPIQSWTWLLKPQYDDERKEFQGTVLQRWPESELEKHQGGSHQGHPRVSQEPRNCSLILENVQETHNGLYGLRLVGKPSSSKWIEELPVNVTASAPKPQVTVPELKENREASITCSLPYACPRYPVHLEWDTKDLGGTNPVSKTSLPTDPNSERTSISLTLHPTWKDHGRCLHCRMYDPKNQLLAETQVFLNVQHIPRNLSVVATPGLILSVGSNVTLKCLVGSSHPPPQRFSWLRDEGKVLGSTGDTLTLVHVGREDNGAYSCHAQNILGEGESEKVQLQIPHLPLPSQVQLPQTAVAEGSTVMLTCETAATPAVSLYRWFHDGREVLQEMNRTLTLKDLGPHHSGLYTCQGQNSQGWGESEKGAQLDVQYPPVGVEVRPENATPIREGDAVTLTCSYNRSNPPVSSYSWDVGSLPHISPSEGVLYIFRVPWNPEPVTCTVINPRGFASSQPLHLDVQYAPQNVRVALDPPQPHVRAGARVRLRCEFSSSRPPAVSYGWSRDGWALAGGRDLEFAAITPEEAGRYSCSVTNAAGSTRSREWDLVVQYPPRRLRVSIFPDDTVMERTAVALTCEADANPGVFRYSWFDERGRELPYSGRKLTLAAARAGHSGAYWCQGTNGLGTGQSPPSTLTVHYSPQTIAKRAAMGIGASLAVFVLSMLGVRLVQRWMKRSSWREVQAQGPPRGHTSFFVGNKIRGPLRPEAPRSMGFSNPGLEDTISYATLRFPTESSSAQPPGTVEDAAAAIRLQLPDDCVTYSVLQIPPGARRPVDDYENVAAASAPPPPDEGLHYSELLQFPGGPRPPAQDHVEYAALRH